MTAPTTVIRSVIAKDGYKVGETEVIFGTYQSFNKENPQGILWVHPLGDTAMGVFNYDTYIRMMKTFGKMGTMAAGDFGFETWGNTVATDAIDDMIDRIVSLYGVVPPVVLISASMGACNALNYLRLNPERVQAVVAMLPAVDLTYLHTGNPGPIDAAYPPSGYSEATHGATHNPMTFATSLDPDIPIGLWYASDDTAVRASDVVRFDSLAPNSYLADPVTGGHTIVSIEKVLDDVVDWVKDILAA